MKLHPLRLRRFPHVAMSDWATALFGLTKRPSLGFGCQLLQQFELLWHDILFRETMPVTLPPGLLRLATRPARTGSAPV